MKTCALIVAAGKSERFGGVMPKQFRNVCGRPMLSWTISRFEAATAVDEIILVVAEDYLLCAGETVVDPFKFEKVTRIVSGGASRTESVFAGLKSMSPSSSFVAIHDGDRPITRAKEIDRVIECAKTNGAAVLATPVADTVKRVDQSRIVATLNRDNLYLAETPQVFQYDMILEAHRRGADEGRQATDDAGLFEALGFEITVVESVYPNLKVTVSSDLSIVEALLKEENGE